MIRLRVLVCCVVTLISYHCFSQCDNIVPIATIDVSSSPGATGTTTISGSGRCCDNQANNLNCGILEITLHPSSAGINVTFNGPNQCGIDVWYDVSCPASAPDLTSICNPICVTGPDVELLLCKSGNFNNLSINVTSIPAVILDGFISPESCNSALNVYGLVGSIDWSCTGTDPDNGVSLLDYLDCGSGPGIDITCESPSFNYTGPSVTDCAGKVLTYCVVAPATDCSPAQNVTGDIILYPNITGEGITKTCSANGTMVTLTAINDLTCNIDYLWSTGETTQSITVPNDGATYSVEFFFTGQSACVPVSASTIASCCSLDVSCPIGPVNLECISQLPAGPGSVMDFNDLGGVINSSCNPPTVTFSDSDDGASGCVATPRTVTRTITVSDPMTGESVDCPIDYVFADVSAPMITCPGSVTIECTEDVPAADITLPVTNDNCLAAVVVSHEGDVSDGLTCPEMVTRTYRVTDACDNTSECDHIITVDDTTDPTITCPGSVTVECIEDVPSADITLPVTSDNCLAAFVVTHEGDASDGMTCAETITRTYRVTDACNNTAECEQIITVDDTTDPTIACWTSVTIECIEDVPPVDLALPVTGDNCLADIVVTYEGDVSDGLTCPEMITRTYRVTDACDNTAECDQIITIDDITDPTITCPGPVTVECTEDAPAADITLPVTGDNCMAAVVVTHEGDVSDGLTCPEMITRTYRVTDACDNTAECDQIITVDDITDPTITCPGAVTVECAEDVPSSDITLPVTGDNCVFAVVVTHEGDSSDGLSCPEMITRTYRVTDACDNTAECDQIITVDDITDPTITCPGAVTVECTEDVPSSDITLPVTGDNCVVAVVVTHEGDSSDGLSCPEMITRTYRVTDACDNTAECDQIITVDDITDPTITCPGAVTVECTEDVPSSDITLPVTGDNCVVAVVVTHEGDSSDGLSCPEMITRTYRVTDACDNTAECDQIITIDDITDPTIACPGPVTIECTENVPSADITLPVTGDNCVVAVVVTHEGDSSDGLSCPEMITRTYRVTDACDNTAECDQIITVDDITDPTITCPGAVTVECAEDVPASDITLPVTGDNCVVAVVVTHEDDSSDGLSCPEMITRTYRVTDACDNTAECDQIITVDDITDPTITCPGPVTVECTEDVPVADITLPVTGDNCVVAVVVTHEGDSSDGLSCPEMITRTYRVIDACDNTAECDQIITVDDITDPTITCPGPVTVECAEDVPASDITLPVTGDNCVVAVVVTHEDDSSDGLSCPEMITRTYRVTDACDNTAECDQIITVDDITDPTITCPGPVTVECTEDVPSADITLPVTGDNCVVAVVVTHEGDSSDGLSCPEMITRTYRVTDACDNTAECDQIITVDDITDPTITCPGPVTVECAEDVPASNITLPVTGDNCVVAVVVTHEGDSSDGLSCPEMITRTYRVTDACDNTAECDQIITVDDITDPTITCPGPVMVECTEDVPVADITLPVAGDNCVVAVVVTHEGDSSDGLSCPEMITRTYRVTDACDNTAECDQIITIDDITDPTIACPGPVSVECIDDVPSSDITLPVTGDNCVVAVVLTHEGDLSDGLSCAETITRTYRVTDACDNTAECTQAITVDDVTAPIINCPPADITVNVDASDPTCDFIVIFSPPTIIDNCDAFPTIMQTTGPSSGSVFPLGATMISWTATDACGNTSVCSYNIDVVSSGTPVMTCPTNPTNICNDPGTCQATVSTNTLLPTISYCPDLYTLNYMVSEQPSMTIVFSGEVSSIPADFTLAVGSYEVCWDLTPISTGTALNCCFDLFINDCESPLITCSAQTTPINCPVSPVWVDPIVSNDCDLNPSLVFSDVTTPACGNSYSVTRTWTATDTDGNSSTCSATIVVQDISSPTISCPTVLNLECIEDVPAPDINLPIVNDSCDPATLVVTHEGDVSDGLTCPEMIIRTYRVTDACDNTAECEQIINIDDITNPTIACVDCASAPAPQVYISASDGTGDGTCGTGGEFVTICLASCSFCPASVDLSGWEIEDDASNDGSPATTINFISGSLQGGECLTIQSGYLNGTIPGNPTGTLGSVFVIGSDRGACPVWNAGGDNIYLYDGDSQGGATLIDTEATTAGVSNYTAPVISCSSLDITVECIEDVPSADITIPFAEDNCVAAIVVTHEGDVSDGLTCPEMITRTYRVTDACDNTAECTQVITIDDITDPTITCPGTVTVECAEDIPVEDITLPVTVDNCVVAVVVTHEGDSSDGLSCPEMITRTYRVTDACDNTAECDQIITVDDITDPTITCPGPVTVECTEDVPASDITLPVTGDNCVVAVVVTHEGDSSDGLSCPEMITRTYRVTDACDNTAECDQIITVDDITDPTITCPGPVTVECAEDVPASDITLPVTVDNCVVAVVVTHEGDSSDGLSCPEMITRTYRVTDACDNTAECDQIITVDDITDPTITCPGPVTVECAEDIPVADITLPVTGDNCVVAVVLTHEGDSSDGLSCPEMITRTYRVTDACDNTAECDQIITVDDITDPTITCPGPVTFECAEDVPSSDITLPVTGDNCVVAVVVTHEGDSSDGLSCPEMITRTYRVTDACDNTAECDQIITVDDITDPTITCPGPVTVECTEDVPVADITLPVTGDNCVVAVVVTHEGDSSDGLSCPEMITRTYRVTDACDNTAECDQIITVDDITDPTITCPGPVTVECAEDVPASNITLPVTGDNCVVAVVVTHEGDSSDGLSCPEMITRTYRVTDACDNTAECDQIITVDDITDPTITCPGPVMVECTEDVPVADITLPVAGDNCVVAVVVTHEGDSSDGLLCPEMITRTYRVTDACDNTAECDQIITVDDITDPTITCPGPVSVDCIEDVPSADITLPVTGDNCVVAVVVTHEGDSSDGLSCPEMITRTYRVTDACDNTAECNQIITVVDITNPTIACWTSVTVECIEDVPAVDLALPIYGDNCMAAVVVTHEGDVSDGASCAETITRTYRVTDACDNTAECEQIITVDDVTDPTITCPNPVNVECIEDVPAADINLPITGDNCLAVLVVTHEGDISDGASCAETITRTYKVTDECDNTAECTQIITVDDVSDPTITCPAEVNVECIEDVPTADITLPVTGDNCLAALVVTHEGDVSDGASCAETITRTYRVTDECDNTAECDQIITVDDITDPTITCPGPVSGECLEDIPIADITLPVTGDNCLAALVVTHEGDVPDGMSCPATILRTYRVTDECDNTAECDQIITINDNIPPTISCPGGIDCTTAPDAVVYIASSEGTGDGTCGVGGEYVEICLIACVECPESVDLTGWEIEDDASNDGSPATSINFLGGSLQAGECITIHSGYLDGSITGNPTGTMGSVITIGSDRASCPIWNNGGDNIYLYDGDSQGGATLIDTEATTAGMSSYTAPTLMGCPMPGGAISLECIEDIPGADITLPVVSDNCMASVVVTHEGDVSDGLSCPETITRTYRATDGCGNTAECIQVFIVNDIIDPTITCPSPVGVECIEDVPASDITLPVTSDNCLASLTVTHEGDVSDGMSCAETVTRTYRVTDECENTAECDQIITVDDVTDPTISCPAAVNVECIEDVPAADITLPVTGDNCLAALVVTHEGDVSDGASCAETITRTYRVTDECDNTAECDQIITVDDVTDPTIACPAAANVECIEDVPATDITLPVTDDNCVVAVVVTHEGDSSDGLTCPEMITRTYRVTDECDNTAECDQIITVDDVTNPTIECPGPVDIECIEDVPVADNTLPVTDDNCMALLVVTYEGDVSDGLSCPETITRTYRVTDACDNTAECDQIITINDITPPTISCPGGVDCSTAPDAVVYIASSEGTGDGTCGVGGEYVEICIIACVECPETVDLTGWEIEDDASNDGSPATSINFLGGSLQAGECVTIQSGYLDGSIAGNPTGTMGSVIIIGSDRGACPLWNNSGDNIFLYDGDSQGGGTLIDAESSTAGNSTYAIPVLSCPSPEILTVECIEDVPVPDISLPMTSDNCIGPITVTHEGDVSDGQTCPETITRTYRATDACGNSSECTETILVDDTTNPIPSCNDINVTLSAGVYNFTQDDIDAIGNGSSDNCGEVSLSLNIAFVDCNDAPQTEVILTVTDECENTATCTATVNIEGEAPDLEIGTYGPYCNNEPAITLTGTPPPGTGDTGTWTGTDGVTDPSNLDGTAIFDPAGLDGIYTVTYTYFTSFGCESSASTDITVFDSPMLVISDCMCDYDPNINNIGSLINYSVVGGTGPYTVTTTFGTLENSNPSENLVYNLYFGVAGGTYTITVTDANGCSDSYSSSCDNCYFEPASITDPCSCNNDQSYNGAEDGTFNEVVDIMGPGGLNLIVGAGSTGMSVPIGTPIPQVAPNLYRLSFDHVDLIGYVLFVEGVGPNGTFPILDAAGNQLTADNTCQYPVITEPNIAQTAFCNNGEALIFTGDEVEEISGFDGIVQVYVGSQTFGDLITEFDPSLYQNGIYTLTFVFNGDFVSDMGTPANPGFPGCSTSTSIEIGVGGGGALTCNDNINISVNNDCELDFSWYTLMEADAIPNVFNAVFTDSAGNIVDESDLSNYVGSSLTYSILDMCNGNSCWGTINIDDKSIPEVACDCPVGGEDGEGTPDSYSEDCTLTCYEFPLLKEGYWDNLRDDLVPEDVGDFIDDNVTSVCDDVTEADVSYYDVYEDLGCEGSLMRRTWTVSYDKGFGVAGTVSCTREYFFQPLLLETVDTARIDPITGLVVVSEDSLRLPFHLVELDCGADISPAGIAAYFDNPASVDQDTDDDNIDPDELDVDCVIESNEGVVYAYPHFYIQGRNPAGPHAQPINTEICNIIIAYTDQEIEACAPGCAGNRKILREWTILDWCASEFIQYQQIIKSVDQGAPIIEVSDVSMSVDPWKCSADVLLPHPEHLRDGCDGELTYWIGAVEGGLTVTGNATDGYVLHDALEGVSWTVEYVTEDCCGNRATAEIEVSVVDLTPPVPVTKEFIVLSLVNIGNPEDEEQGIAKLFAVDVDNGSYDGCTGITVDIRRAEAHCEEFNATTDWADHVKFCCGDLEGQAFVEIDVEFRVTDEHGNVNYAWSTVRLEDKSSPTQICPPDLVLTCDMDYNDFTMTGLPQMFSACGEIDLMCDPNDLIEDTEPRRKGPNDGFFNNPLYDGVEVAAYDPSCGFGAVRRQFRSCSSCVQWFVIEPIDAFDATTIVWPSDQTVDCDDFDTGEPSWEESVCNLVGVTLSSDTFLFEDGACFKILNHWSIINWCLYDASNPNGEGRYNYTQVIKIIDTQDPVMTVEDSLCFAVDIDCLSKGVQLSGSAVDEGDCGSDWLKWEVTIDLYSDWDLDYYYATALPRLVNGEPNPYHIAPTGNGELATVTLPDGIESTKQWHRAVWRSYDGCGNNISTVRYFQITDKKAPTPYCLNLSTAVMSGSGTVELWAIDFNVGSFDNCTENDNLIFTFTDVAPPPRDDSEYDSSSDLMWYNGTFWYYNSETGEYEDQDDYGDEVHRWEPGLRSAGKIFTVADADASGFAQIPIYVWDECGNKDFCLVNLRLIDNMGVGEGRIAGQIVTEYGEEVEGVMTELMGASPEYPLYSMTNAAGEYAFTKVPFNSDYEVSGTRSDDYLNGVSTLDILLIQKHILGQVRLDSPYKMIAADVNNDKLVSAIDLIELRKLILGIYQELPDNPSWKTIDAEQNLTVLNPWIYDERLTINDLNTNMEDEDFIGVKIGDVNNTASANVRSGETEQKSKGIKLTYNDRYLKQGEIVEIQMTGNTEENIYGYQFTMSTGGLELVEVKGDNLDNSNVAVFESVMTMSYNDVHPISGELFTLVFKATQEGKISDIININSAITKAEAYVGENLKVVDIDLRGSEDRAIEFALYQNQPNPFSEYTLIGFVLPQSGEVTLTLYDVTGKILQEIEIDGTQGFNEIRVNKSDVNVSGLVYYQLKAGENIATRHMMMIE